MSGFYGTSPSRSPARALLTLPAFGCPTIQRASKAGAAVSGLGCDVVAGSNYSISLSASFSKFASLRRTPEVLSAAEECTLNTGRDSHRLCEQYIVYLASISRIYNAASLPYASAQMRYDLAYLNLVASSHTLWAASDSPGTRP